MVIASINMNKRTGNLRTRSILERWLMQNAVDIVCIQEPWSRSAQDHVAIKSYVPIGGNSSVFSYVRKGISVPELSSFEDWMQRLGTDVCEITNVYLSAHSSGKRTLQLLALRDSLMKSNGKPQVIVGDFNLAPSPEDGVTDGQHSKFNSARERETLRSLLADYQLVDVMHPGLRGIREFTIERSSKQHNTSFRCDLALLTDTLTAVTLRRYDSTTRTGPDAFTDHSAILLDIPTNGK